MALGIFEYDPHVYTPYSIKLRGSISCKSCYMSHDLNYFKWVKEGLGRKGLYRGVLYGVI